MEKVFKNSYHCYRTSAINTQVKDHIPLKKNRKNLGTVDLSRFEKSVKNEKWNIKRTSLLHLKKQQSKSKKQSHH